MGQKMGFLYGLEEGKSQYCKRQNRWLFEIPGVVADDTPGVDALPPEKSARPNLSFKEMEAKHLIEDVYYPAKPEWKPITITLFDLKKSNHPVWEWIIKVYDPKQGKFWPVIRQGGSQQPKDIFIKDCYLKMFDGCGNLVETWAFEDSWIQAANFQSLDMGNGNLMTCDITLRYARAYWEGGGGNQHNL
jgi:hypothetical protein